MLHAAGIGFDGERKLHTYERTPNARLIGIQLMEYDFKNLWSILLQWKQRKKKNHSYMIGFTKIKMRKRLFLCSFFFCQTFVSLFSIRRDVGVWRINNTNFSYIIDLNGYVRECMLFYSLYPTFYLSLTAYFSIDSILSGKKRQTQLYLLPSKPKQKFEFVWVRERERK